MNILDSTNEFVAKAIMNNTLGGEGIDYAVGLGVVPDGNGQPAMVTTLVLRMSSIIINQEHTIGLFIPTPVPTEGQVEESVRNGILALRKSRDEESASAAKLTQSRPSGLIMG